VKLLFDENLSPRLSRLLEEAFPGSLRVRDCGLNKASDVEVWGYARAQEFAIVSKDSDFQELSVIWGSPPKVILLRIPNCTVNELVEIISSARERIEKFLQHESETCMILTNYPEQRSSC